MGRRSAGKWKSCREGGGAGKGSGGKALVKRLLLEAGEKQFLRG